MASWWDNYSVCLYLSQYQYSVKPIDSVVTQLLSITKVMDFGLPVFQKLNTVNLLVRTLSLSYYHPVLNNGMVQTRVHGLTMR